MNAARLLKEKINNDVLVTGVIASFHLWPGLVEICRNAGLDYLIIDLEHGAYADDIVAETCAVGRLIDFSVLIRPHANDFATIRKVADMGPCGLMLAVVNEASTLDEVRDGIYLPPRGKRRPGGPGNRWINDFNYDTWKREVEEDFIVLPQIETRTGLENAAEIARHELTTAIAIGPYDLSADLEVCWEPESPKLLSAIEHIRQAGQAAGKKMWMIGDGANWHKQGYNFLCIAEPIILMESTLKAAVQGLRAGQDVEETRIGYEFSDNPV